jgi:hypothetical protein
MFKSLVRKTDLLLCVICNLKFIHLANITTSTHTTGFHDYEPMTVRTDKRVILYGWMTIGSYELSHGYKVQRNSVISFSKYRTVYIVEWYDDRRTWY